MAANAKFKVKTTIEFNEKELVEAMQNGFFTGRKIVSLEWLYKNVVADTGRGNATYERAVTGLLVEFKG